MLTRWFTATLNRATDCSVIWPRARFSHRSVVIQSKTSPSGKEMINIIITAPACRLEQMEHCHRNPWLLSIFLSDFFRSMVQVAGRICTGTSQFEAVQEWWGGQHSSCSHSPCTALKPHSDKSIF